MYILASLKMQGWLSRTGQYTSDRSDAKRFTREAAFEMCKRHKNQANLTLIPVRLEDINAI